MTDLEPFRAKRRSINLRQSVLLSAFETPELRSFFNKALVNVAGKIKAEVKPEGVLIDVPKGIKQVFTRFDTADLYSEDDSRFEHFTTKVSFFFPVLLANTNE
jgi:U3 small nucleolar RNA-associated protein 25